MQRELVTPACVLLAPPASSLSPDANGGTDLLVFLMHRIFRHCDYFRRLDAEGGVERVLGYGGCYRTVIAKPVEPVAETFYSIPTNSVNCWDFDRRIPQTSNYRGLDRQIP